MNHRWSSPNPGLLRQQNIPEVVITDVEERPWVGALVQGEGSIMCHYRVVTDSTVLDVSTRMTDPSPIFRLSDLYHLPRPSRPKVVRVGKPVWRKDITGLRAFRVLGEILPFLFGEKRKEAEKALSFFDPYGYHRGCFNSVDIWPSNEFPLRRRVSG